MCKSIYEKSVYFDEEYENDFKFKFDEFHFDEWEYCYADGVGLKFEGIPNSEKDFVEYLQSHSCNPLMSHKICDDLVANGIRYSTVMSHLDFNKIYRDLLKMNVTISIVPPVKMADNGLTFNASGRAHVLIDFDKDEIRSKIKEMIEMDKSFNRSNEEEYIQMNIEFADYLKRSIKERGTVLGLYKR